MPGVVPSAGTTAAAVIVVPGGAFCCNAATVHSAGDDAVLASTAVTPTSRRMRLSCFMASHSDNYHSGALRRAYQAAHGVGRHFDPSGSFLKCELVVKGWFKYLGSSTSVVTVSH